VRVAISPHGQRPAHHRRAGIDGDGLTVTGSGGDSQTVTDPGFAISLPGPGGSPSLPGAVSVTDLAAFLATLEGRAGGNGGAASLPTDASLAGSGIGQVVSGNLIESIRQALNASLDEAAVAASGLAQMPFGLFGAGRAFGQGVTTSRRVTVSASAPCR
jgi:hypothetical protein